jgi:hypothetical protein
MTCRDIADLLGLTLETVSRALSSLARARVIVMVPDGARILNIAQIESLARTQFSSAGRPGTGLDRHAPLRRHTDGSCEHLCLPADIQPSRQLGTRTLNHSLTPTQKSA